MLDDGLFQWSLGSEDVVVDGGGYRGEFVRGIRSRYGSRVMVYEMVPGYAEAIEREFRDVDGVRVHPFGLWVKSGEERVRVGGDETSLCKAVNGDAEEVRVQYVDVVSALAGVDEIGLLKLNIEGMEFGVLGRLIETGLIGRVRQLLVQFHRGFVPDSDAWRDRIREKLEETHRELWCREWQWEAWERL